MKKPILGAGALALSGALVLSGCSASDEKPAGDVTITYSNFISNGGNEDNLKTIVAAFEKENPGITVKVMTTDYANYFTKLQTDLSAGTEADVLDVDAGSFPSYVGDGVFAALEGVDPSAYRQSVLDTYAVDGAQYGLPTSFSDVVLYYNKELFDKAGLEYPTADWTWKDEQAAAAKLTDKAAGVWGDFQPITYNEYYKAVQQAGGEFLGADGKAAFDSPEGIAAAEWLAGKSGTTMPTAADGAETPDFSTGLFKDGKLAMWHTGIWMFGALKEVPFEWDIAVEPGDSQKASAMFSNAVVVSNNSKNKEAAQKFAEFLSSSDVMVDTRIEAGWELPAVSDESRLDPYLNAAPPANRKAVFDALEAVAPQPNLGRGSQQIQDAVNNALGEIAAGRAQASEAIPALAKTVNDILAK
ncbi:MAG: sugar ABC transporter substrate-binding protein [Microbacterium sp.]